MEKMDISIIIPVRNRNKYLIHCLEAIANQTLPPSEVIVVDQGGVEDSKTICKNTIPDIKHIYIDDREPFHGSHTINVGIKASTCKMIMVLLADCILSRDFIEKISDIYAGNEKNFVVRVSRSMSSETDGGLFMNRKIDFDTILTRSKTIDPFSFGSCYVVERKVITEIGGYDENYGRNWGYEDIDVENRLREYGCKMFDIFPKTRLVHLWHENKDYLHDSTVTNPNHIYYYKMKSIRKSNRDKFIFRNNI